MKTLREYIDIVEGKGNIDDKIIHFLTQGVPAEEIARKLDIPVEWVHEVTKYNMPDSAIDYNDPRNSTQGRERFGEQGVAEAIDRKDLLARLQKDLPKVNDPENKNAKPVNWTGPGKDDYGYTGYQGHGMPTDKQERDRIRADKKKGVKEEATPEAVDKINKLFRDK